MFSLRVVVFLSLVWSGLTDDVPCPSGCKCSIFLRANCMGAKLSQVPPGYFKTMQELDLMGNNIESIREYDLSGFPDLRKITLSSNKLTQLDLNAFTVPIYLGELTATSNQIANIIPLEEGKTLINLKVLELRFNQITSLHEGFLEGMPRIERVWMSYNQLIVPGDRPIGSSRTLQLLQLTSSNVSAISSLTFQGLPQLDTLYLESTGITDLGDSLSYLPALKNLYIEDNPIPVIRRGTFSKAQNITRFDMRRTQVTSMEVAVLEGSMGGSVSISDTPMACNCNYDALYWWSVARNIILYASCANTNCDFTKKF